MLFRKSVSNFIVPKNFTELQVNYTRQEAQYFINLIKNEALNEPSSCFSSPTFSSIYSIDIESEDISENSDTSSSTLYCKSPSLFSPVNNDFTINDSRQSSKRSFNNSEICSNSFENYSNKRLRIKLES